MPKAKAKPVKAVIKSPKTPWCDRVHLLPYVEKHRRRPGTDKCYCGYVAGGFPFEEARRYFCRCDGPHEETCVNNVGPSFQKARREKPLELSARQWKNIDNALWYLAYHATPEYKKFLIHIQKIIGEDGQRAYRLGAAKGSLW